MARGFAKRFYSSKAWQSCRNEYAARAHYLCEDCLRRGIYRPGAIVHHKIEIDPVTIEHPEIALNFDNLELLCRECHAARHDKGRKQAFAERRAKNRQPDRFRVNQDGRVVPR